MAANVDYGKWSKDSLIERLVQLEKELQARPAPPAAPVEGNAAAEDIQPAPKKRKEKPKMDPTTKSFRFIALRLAYLGRNYGGFEYSASGVLPSIEEELFKALTKTCLIFPEDERAVDFGNCEYSKCGRTDRGVSAFGQVIALRVRSAKPTSASRNKRKKVVEQTQGAEAQAEATQTESEPMETDTPEPPPFDPIRDEIDYPKVLNRVLPPDIRILGWCPSPPPDFSARFSCRERQYRYFFTQPAFSPSLPSRGQKNVGWLDIDAMRDAAKRYEGEHDFRNFCKIDPAKNITNFKRGILEATIEEVPDMGSAMQYLSCPPDLSATESGQLPKVYCFKVRGTAFLWHQIRNMVSILFLVGQGLEKPDLVDKLLDIEKNPRRPVYVMADEVPLVLWDCLFTDENGAELPWIHVEDSIDPAKPNTAFGTTEGLWKLWREVKMDEILANRLLNLVAQPLNYDALPFKEGPPSVKLFEGGNSGRQAGKHVPVMKMALMETPEEQSNKFAQRRGFASAEDRDQQRYAKKAQANAAE